MASTVNKPDIDRLWLLLSGPVLADLRTCGRPTRKNTPCRNQFRLPYPGCVRHLTGHEWAELACLAKDTEHRLAELLPQANPACWLWPIPPDLGEGPLRVQLRRWHERRCAICGMVDRLVEDHDHVTGRTRGMLCVSCNVGEPSGDDESRYGRYRSRPPAVILDLVFDYIDPLGRSPVTRRAPEDVDARRSPVHQVSRALLGPPTNP